MESRAAGYRAFLSNACEDSSLASLEPGGLDALCLPCLHGLHEHVWQASIGAIWQLAEPRRVQGQIRQLIRKGALPCSPAVLRDRTRFVSRQSSGCYLTAVLHAAHVDVEAKIRPTHRLCP